MKTLIATLVLSAALLTPQFAGAQEIVCPKSSTNPDKNKEEARRYFSMGITFYKMQNYKKSVVSFNCVINLVPYSTMARFRLALSYKHLKMYDKAAEHLKWVLVDVSAEAKPLKGQAQKHMKEIQDILDARKAEADRKAAAKHKAEEERKRAELARLKAENDRKAAAVRKAEADRKKAEAAKKDAKLPGPVKGPEETSSTAMTSTWWFWTGVGATAVFTLATVGLGFKTLAARDIYEQEYDDEGPKSDLILYRTLTDVALGAAIISGALLVYGILTHNDKPMKPAEVQTAVLPMCSGTGCGISFTLAF